MTRKFFLVFLVSGILLGSPVGAHLALNYRAINQCSDLCSVDCPAFLEYQVSLGEAALKMNNRDLALRYAERLFDFSGKFPCSLQDEVLLKPIAPQWGYLILDMDDVNEESLPTWLSMWAWGNHWQLVRVVAAASIERYPGSLWAYYYLAQAESHLRHPEIVREVYLEALEIFPDEALLHRELARWYYNHDDEVRALQWYQSALMLDPDEPTALLGMWYIFSQEGSFKLSDQEKEKFRVLLDNAYSITKYTKPDGRNFVLTEYVFDEDLFSLSQGVDIEWFGFWKALDESIEPVGNWMQIDSLWMSYEQLQNWASNPRFAWDSMAARSVIPRGYRPAKETGILSDYALAVEQREEEKTYCAQLMNISTDRTGLYTLPRAMLLDTCYFQSGWIKSSQEAKAYIGYEWLDGSYERSSYGYYGYAASEIQDVDWQPYAKLIIPPQDARKVLLRLLNLGHGTVCFDDIVFAPISCQ